MAEGGEVGHFCDKDRAHDYGCEYFSDGGPVGSLGDMDPSHAISGHIARGGLLGMLKMDKDKDLDKYDKSVHRGHKILDSNLDRIFDGQKPEPIEDRSKHHKAIDDWISDGGINKAIQQEVYNQNDPQSFAHGGEAEKQPDGILNNHPIETAYPQQNVMLQSAKGRASNYLNALRPQENAPKLAFDDKPDQTEQKKKYNKAIKIADQPLSVLHDVANGKLDPEHVQHLKAMYPEVHDSMHKKITEKVIQAQMDEKKPNSKVRQGLSMLIGTPLSGELTPQGIQAAQSVFIGKQKQQPTQPSGKSPGNSSKLSKSDQAYMTGQQSLVARSQRKT